MRRTTIVLSRVLAYIDFLDMVPGGFFLPDFVQSLVERYKFQQFPTDFADFKIDEGIEFGIGKVSKAVAIDKFKIWPNILTLETRLGTDASVEALAALMQWASEKHGLTYHEGDIKRFAYINSVTFYSEEQLLYVDPILEWLSREASSLLSDIWQEPVEYRPTSLKLGHDPVLRHMDILPFSIERRGQNRFSENKYFSQAPLPTSIHLQLLKEFEERVLRGSGSKAYGSREKGR